MKFWCLQIYQNANKIFVSISALASKMCWIKKMHMILIICDYRKVASSNTSHLEAHVGFFQVAYEGDFWTLGTLDKKLIF